MSEILTADERLWLSRQEACCAKALRIIDAHAADRAALVGPLEAAKLLLVDVMLDVEQAAHAGFSRLTQRTEDRLRAYLTGRSDVPIPVCAHTATAFCGDTGCGVHGMGPVSSTDGSLVTQSEAKDELAERLKYQTGEQCERVVRAETLLRGYRVHFSAPGDSVYARAAVESIDAVLDTAASGCAPTHAALVAKLSELTRERDEARAEVRHRERKTAELVEALAAAERADVIDGDVYDTAMTRAKAAEARVEALETLLAASEARAAQWQADAESYRADANVAQDRLAALQERVNSVIEQAPDGFQVDAASLKRVLRGC